MTHQRSIIRSKTFRTFATSHARAPNVVRSYAPLSETSMASNITQNHGEKSIPNRSLVRQVVDIAQSKTKGRTGISQIDCQLDRSLNILTEEMTCVGFQDSIWGFVVYRCVEGRDAAWDLLLGRIRVHIDRYLKSKYLAVSREDLLKFHELHVVDDKNLYGASIKELRTHFHRWVAKSLQSRLKPGAANPTKDLAMRRATSTPRYEYCLVVDEICLESLDYPFPGKSPVVKLVCRDWETDLTADQRLQETPWPYHAGITEYDEEDVGWMYMSLDNYMEYYTDLQASDWDDVYRRPPYIDGSEDETNMIGHWRGNHAPKRETAEEK